MTILRQLRSWRSGRFHWWRLAFAASAASLVVAGLTAVPAAAATTYAVTATIGVGSGPYGVGIDPSTGTVYVANEQSNTVSVIDEATGTVTATIGVGNDPVGVGVDPASDTVYVANTDDNTVSVIDGATGTVTATIGVGNFPEAVGVDPATDTVYVANTLDNSVSVIDGATNAVTATIGVGSNPEAVGVDPATGTVYVSNFLDGTVSVIDEATGTVTATIGVGSEPYGVGVDPAAGTVYVANDGDNTVSVIDGATGTVTATIGVGNGPSAVGVDPSTHAAYVANFASDTVSVISPVTVATPTLTTTPSPTSVTLGTTAPTLTDSAVLSGGSAPTGTITFTLYYDGGSTPVDTETVPVSGNGTYSTPAGYTLPATGTVTGTYQWDAAYSGDANNNAVSDNGAANEQVVVSPAATTLSYTGPDQVAVNSGFTATATLTSPAAACYMGQPVTLSVSPDPLNTAISSLTLGTPDSTASGAISLAVSTTGWANGVYTITATDPGTANCAASTGTGSLAVTVPGQLAFGGGWYTVPGVGPTSFGFVVAHGPKNAYLGALSVVTPGKWWFQANVTSFGLTGTTQGLLAGTGSLYSWNATLNKGHGGWHLVQSGVTYDATADATTMTATASFGITINYPPASGLPNSAPVTLSRGGIVIT
jgi:YVTN family beta-propeller protein